VCHQKDPEGKTKRGYVESSKKKHYDSCTETKKVKTREAGRSTGEKRVSGGKISPGEERWDILTFSVTQVGNKKEPTLLLWGKISGEKRLFSNRKEKKGRCLIFG